MRIGSLFSGAGGLDMAVEQVFGGHTVWHCEVDPAASKVLAHRWPGVPNHTDITAVDWTAVEPVDVLCGGFPCQDVSSAGRRAGIREGTRSGLWAMFAEAIAALHPPIVVIENVRGLLSAKAHRPMEPQSDALGDGDSQPVLRAIGAVLGDLSDLGYDAQWATVSAASVGAPHRRERVFIVATDTKSGGTATAQLSGRLRRPIRSCDDASHSSGVGWDEGRPESARLVGGSDAAVSGDGPVELLPTPKAAPRASRKAMTQQHWSAPGLEQALEIARGELPREFASWDEVPGRSRPDLLPTPCAQQSGNTPENHLAKKPGRKVVTDLAILVENGLMATGGELLPTPNAQDGNGGKQRSPEALARGDHQANLTDLPRLLPTPQARDWKGGQANQFDINDAVSLLPTPRSSDCFGAGLHGDGGMDLRTTVSLLPTPRSHRRGDCESERNRKDPDLEATTHHFPKGQWGKYEPAIRRWEQVTRQAPAPTEPNKNGNPRLSAAFSEWMLGWPEGWVTEVPGISRNDQLRIIGNGVVPQCAAAALYSLIQLAEVTA